MELHHFIAPDMRTAIELVKNTLGMEALILSHKTVEGGVEVQAAIERVNEITESHDSHHVVIKNSSPEINNPNYEAFSTSIKAEINMLRSLIEMQMGMNNLKNPEKLSFTQLTLKRTMMSSFFSKTIIKDILSNISSEASYELAVQNACELIGNLIKISETDVLKKEGIYAIIGSTGAGKTTSIAKIAASYIQQNSQKNIGIISTDFHKVGAHEQLSTYCKIFKIPLLPARSQEEFTKALSLLGNKKLILIDTTGFAPHADEIKRKLDTLSAHKEKIKFCLTISANSNLNSVQKTFNIFNAKDSLIHIDECMITKVDENTLIGGLLSLLIENNTPVSYIGKGQHISSDFEVATQKKLAALALNPDDTTDSNNLIKDIRLTTCEE